MTKPRGTPNATARARANAPERMKAISMAWATASLRAKAPAKSFAAIARI
jgi:hypothetical protein